MKAFIFLAHIWVGTYKGLNICVKNWVFLFKNAPTRSLHKQTKIFVRNGLGSYWWKIVNSDRQLPPFPFQMLRTKLFFKFLCWMPIRLFFRRVPMFSTLNWNDFRVKQSSEVDRTSPSTAKIEESAFKVVHSLENHETSEGNGRYKTRDYFQWLKY